MKLALLVGDGEDEIDFVDLDLDGGDVEVVGLVLLGWAPGCCGVWLLRCGCCGAGCCVAAAWRWGCGRRSGVAALRERRVARALRRQLTMRGQGAERRGGDEPRRAEKAEA